MDDEWIPIIFFLTIPLIIFVSGYWGYRGRKESQETLRRIVDKGETLTPELIRAVGTKPGKKGKFSDLKTGLVLIAVTLALIIFGQTMGFVADDPEPGYVFTGLGAFPGLIGLAYLGFHFFAREDDDQNGAKA